MPRDQSSITVSPNNYQMISDGSVSTISFQVLSGSAYIRVTSDNTQPQPTDRGWLYKSGYGDISRPLDEISALVPIGFVWAISAASIDCEIQVDHA